MTEDDLNELRQKTGEMHREQGHRVDMAPGGWFCPAQWTKDDYREQA